MRILLAVLFSLGLSGAAAAQSAEIVVDLELVLLADASRSIDEVELKLQRQGYATAITDPSVVEAITSGPLKRIAVTYVEWADARSQHVVAGVSVIDGVETAEAFAAELMAAPREAYGRNAIGAALLFGKALIEDGPIRGERRVIDFSADSANSWDGPTIEEAREAVLNAGITINGLAVLCRNCSGRPVSYDLETAFQERIIGGPGAFVITADSTDTFAEAVRRKLILEIAGDGAAYGVEVAAERAR